MKPNIAAIVVLYHPDFSVFENLKTYINQVERMYLIDNTEKGSNQIPSELLSNSKIQYVPQFENTGIAKAINIGVALAQNRGYKWVLLMDQDSYFDNIQLENYCTSLFNQPHLDTIAVAGPEFEKTNNPCLNKETTLEVNSLITSGSIIQVELFKKLGGYDEKLFIDEVDHDFCYRAKIKGYRVIKFTDILMEHQLGKSVEVQTLKGRNKLKTFHSPTRLYYMVRNCCYTINRYKKYFPTDIQVKKMDLIFRIKNHLLYGNDKLKLIKHISLGYLHYKKNHFGKL